MSRSNDRHVVPDEEDGWNVRKENGERGSSHHSTQAEAIDRAREIVTNAGGGEVVVHSRDGRVRDKITVGNPDPFPPRG